MKQKIADPHGEKRKYFIDLVKKRVQPGTGSSINFLNRRTWNQAVTNLNQIIKQASFVVVGGVATRLYMPERMTLDLDILVKSEDAELVYEDLEQARSQKISELSIAGSQWQLLDGTSLDVLEVNDAWATEAIANPNYAPDGLPIVDLPYLVLMKLIAGRSQDLADISRMLGGTPDWQLEQVRRVIGEYLDSAIEDLESLIMLGKLERGS
ncbi:MAG: hypothetical protein F6K47_30720 [Symploca sp. SIO2E6]|nr:hypothetical protein [Symploca sp. SIO2E6]